MKASLTRLVFKRDYRRCLKNWRPISLLNSDYKIGSKALSLRLCKVLGSIINTDQTCSVLHRSISSSLTLLRDTLNFIDRSGETGILISLDQEKAFDRVDRTFLMNLFGFGPSFRNWIFIIYNDVYMQIIVNDFLTSPIKLSRGVRQGDALSPMLYVLYVEVMVCTIRNSSQIEGFLLPGAAGAQIKISQYADDTTVFVKDESSLVYLFRAISLYEKGSGARLNISKTKAMWFGNWKDRCDKPFGLNWVDKMKVLGIVFGNVNVERDNWEPRLSKVDKMLSLWQSRSLSSVGKVLILNTLAFSKLFYLSRILRPPKWVYGRIKSFIWPFLWGSRIETVARRSIICSLQDGGLGLTDFACQSRSFRLAAFVNVLQDSSAKAFFLVKYFCGFQLASIRPDWAFLRDNLTPSAVRPTVFYSRLLQELRSFNFPRSFSFTSKALYSLFLQQPMSVPILPYDWTSYVPTRFSFFTHWKSVRDSFTENFKNDLMFFFYQFPNLRKKNRRLLLLILKSILYGIWRFRSKATFHKGKEKSRGIVKGVSRAIRNRIESDRDRFSRDKFRSL